MSEIVVVDKYRLIERSKGKFLKNEHKKIIRSAIKIEKSEVSNYNKISEQSGILFVINEDATKLRNTLKNKTKTKEQKQ